MKRSNIEKALRVTLTATSLLILAPNCNSADSAPNPQAITIMGNITCADWITARKEENKDKTYSWTAPAIYKTWMLGFLSGLNTEFSGQQDVLGTIDSETVAVWTDKHCKLNPKHDFFEAGKILFKELSKISK